MKLVFQIIRPISLKYSLKGRNAKRQENVYKVNFFLLARKKMHGPIMSIYTNCVQCHDNFGETDWSTDQYFAYQIAWDGII